MPVRTITKTMSTETGHRLTNYSGACTHFHGHSYKWEVTISKNVLNGTGFIIDYKILKQIMKDTIGNLDHAFLLHSKDPIFSTIGNENMNGYEAERTVREILKAANGEEANLHILPFNPTSENIISWVADALIEELNKYECNLVKIKMWETDSSFAEWNQPQQDLHYEGTI